MLGSDESKKIFQQRVNIVLGIILFLFLGVMAKLFWLQIYDANKYSLMSDRNRIRLSPVLPKRGKIFSADGKVLARCKNRYRLVIENCDRPTFMKNLNLLSENLNFSEDDFQNFLEIRKKIPKYAPIIIKDDLSWDEYAKISMNLYKLSNVSIENTYMREYTMPLEFSHVLGYAAKSEDALQILEGKNGIENVMDFDLKGQVGNQQNEINALGKKMRLLEFSSPVNGSDVTLTINSELQKYVYGVLSQEKAGACVVLNIKTKEVLAFVSVPGYDPNIWLSKITQKQWDEIVNDPLKPFLNRVTGGVYPPGSIFKIVVAFTAINEGIISPREKVFCGGEVKYDNATFHCWNRYGHGHVNLYDALRMSCDCYFFEISRKLGIDIIAKYAKRFGFGEVTNIEMPNENRGLMPSKTWKFLTYRSTWKPYETMITSIGQGAVLANLMQAATMMARLYAEDYNFYPTLLKNKKFNEEEIKRPMNHETAMVIKEALFQVCNSETGTARRSCFTDYGISGKTGSSQVRKIREGEAGKKQSSFEWKYRDHALFVGCASQKDPKFVVAVLVEHGGGGASVAAPIARKIFDKIYEIKL